MKIAIVIPDGVGVKNYLYSQLVPILLEKHEVMVWHNFGEKAVDKLRHQDPFRNIQFVKLPKYKEPILYAFVRETICLARLQHNAKLAQNDTITTNWWPSKKGKKWLYFTCIEMLANSYVAKKYQRIQRLEQWYRKKLSSTKLDAFYRVLKEHKVDRVFCTHQRAITAIPAIESAKQLGIPTFGAIFSWDNIPKARLTVATDFYFVWSEYMKKELLYFYPEIQGETIQVTGTPQFEFHDDSSLADSKMTFFENYGLDPNKKTLCFTGNDERTSPFDHLYFEEFVHSVSQLPQEQRPQIVFRRSPSDFSDRFDATLTAYSDIVTPIDPIWERFGSNNWADFLPSYHDVKLLNNLIRHCDAVVNIGSTVALDFSKTNKPAIYLCYDVKQASDWSTEVVYRFQHFRSMGGLNPVFRVHSKEAYRDVLLSVLYKQGTEKVQQDMKAWFDILVSHDGLASQLIAEKLTSPCT